MTIVGTGGVAFQSYGVWLEGGLVTAGGLGAVSVTGTGGSGPGNGNDGVIMTNQAVITSGGGSVTVRGTGGGASLANGVGVNIGFATISSGGTGRISVTGTGGASNGSNNFGVSLGTTDGIVSNGGDVTVLGTGGSGSGDGNHGVYFTSGGGMRAAGTGGVSITGVGGAGGGNEHSGVYFVSPIASVNTTGGAISVTGTAGSGADSRGILLSNAGFPGYTNIVLQAGGNAPVTLTADSLTLGSNISAGTGTITIRPLTPGTRIFLGAQDVVSGSPILGLSDDELDRITTGTLVLGSSNNLMVLQSGITRPAATAVQLIASALYLSLDPIFDTGGGPLTLTVGGSINQQYIGGFSIGQNLTFTASTVSFSPGATLYLPQNSITFPAVALLKVNGTLDLTNLAAVIGSASFTPRPGDVVTLATATSIVGTFVGRPKGSTIVINEQLMTMHYTATRVTAEYVGPVVPPSPPGVPPSPPVVPPPPPPLPRVVTAVGDMVTVRNPTDGSARTFVPFPGFSVNIASADLTGDGVPDVVVGAGPGGGPHVRVFDGASGAELASFFAFPVGFSGGVTVAATAGRVVVGAGPGGGPHLKAFNLSPFVEVRSVFVGDVTDTRGVVV